MFRNYADGGVTTTKNVGDAWEVARLLFLFQPSFFGARFDILFSEDGALKEASCQFGRQVA